LLNGWKTKERKISRANRFMRGSGKKEQASSCEDEPKMRGRHSVLEKLDEEREE